MTRSPVQARTRAPSFTTFTGIHANGVATEGRALAKQKFDRWNRPANTGTIAHIDHGKATLTSAITKVWHTKYTGVAVRDFGTIDNAPEERERGITIAVSHV